MKIFEDYTINELNSSVNAEKIASLLYKDWQIPMQYKTYQHIPKKDYLNEKN